MTSWTNHPTDEQWANIYKQLLFENSDCIKPLMLNNKLNACVVKNLDLFVDEYGPYPKNSDIYMKIYLCKPSDNRRLGGVWDNWY